MKRRTINVGVQSLEDTASENDASKSSSSHFSRSFLLDNKNSSSATAIDQPSKEPKQNKTEDYHQYGGKELSIMVFNPCIMVFLPLFGITMLRPTNMNRKP